MSFPSIMIITVSLGALFWLSSRFGLFQFFMPVSNINAGYGHRIAFGLLSCGWEND